jgi:hypothetical protein
MPNRPANQINADGLVERAIRIFILIVVNELNRLHDRKREGRGGARLLFHCNSIQLIDIIRYYTTRCSFSWTFTGVSFLSCNTTPDPRREYFEVNQCL